MNKTLRTIIIFLTSGAAWYYLMQLFFVWSGAQNILASPARQSDKFLKTFMEMEPLPRMATDRYFVLKGFFVIGLFFAAAFAIINPRLKGEWLQRGLLFGAVQWMLTTPWFEFYLPYNVMNEPFALVLLEGALWLGVSLCMGLMLSFIANFKAKRL